MEKKVLAVGDSTRLEIIYSTGRSKTRSSKSPQIETNEGPPKRRLKISAHGVERPDSTYPIIISPYKLDPSQFTEKLVEKKKFEITNVSDRKLELKLVDLASRYLEVKLPKSIKPGKTAEGEIKIREYYLDESFQKSFTLELNDEKSTRFTVPVKRTVRNLQAKGASEAGRK